MSLVTEGEGDSVVDVAVNVEAIIKKLRFKGKLPQAFMQIVWMEDDFRNLTTKVWANLDNPIKRYDFFKGVTNFVYVALSGDTLPISVMS